MVWEGIAISLLVIFIFFFTTHFMKIIIYEKSPHLKDARETDIIAKNIAMEIKMFKKLNDPVDTEENECDNIGYA